MLRFVLGALVVLFAMICSSSAQSAAQEGATTEKKSGKTPPTAPSTPAPPSIPNVSTSAPPPAKSWRSIAATARSSGIFPSPPAPSIPAKSSPARRWSTAASTSARLTINSSASPTPDTNHIFGCHALVLMGMPQQLVKFDPRLESQRPHACAYTSMAPGETLPRRYLSFV